MTDNQARRCGRPTRAGTPCRRPLQWYETACNAHQTPTETERAYALLRADALLRAGETAGALTELQNHP
jgi:hypothetical protein